MIIKVYDNKGKTIDRYTVLISNSETKQWDIYTMARNPNVFNQYSHSASMYRRHYEEQVNFNSLPLELKKAIKERAHD
jgi:hypothetical protein